MLPSVPEALDDAPRVLGVLCPATALPGRVEAAAVPNKPPVARPSAKTSATTGIIA
jgi:hypothetical protein